MPDNNKLRKVVYDLYQVNNSDDPVFLTLTVGHAQDGSTELKLDGQQFGETQVNSSRIELGKNKDLVNKELKITSLVTDVQTEIDVVSITVVLSGGVEIATWVMVQESEDYESYPFRCTIGFSL